MSKYPVALIAAQANDGVIGKDNQMPWHLPEDFRYFKATTMGKPIVMGRKTYESIGKPLPGRTNIVITRQKNWTAEGVISVSGLDDALSLAAEESPSEIMVIGGGQVYAEALPLANRIYLTRIDTTVEGGDAWFPDLGDDWEESVVEEGVSEKQGLSYRFCVLQRVTKG